MASQEEQTHQEQAQSGQVQQQSLLELEEGGVWVAILAGVDGLIEALVQFTAELVQVGGTIGSRVDRSGEVVEPGWTFGELFGRVREAHGVESWLVHWDGKQQPE